MLALIGALAMPEMFVGTVIVLVVFEKAPLAPWEMLAQVLLLTNEFMFVD